MYTRPGLCLQAYPEDPRSISALLQLRDVLLIGVQGIQKAVVGVDGLPGQRSEDLALFPRNLLQATQGPAVELGLVVEGFDPVLEKPPGEPHAALLRLESLVHGCLVPFSGEPIESLRGFPVAPRVSLVHCKPPIPPICAGSKD